MSSRASWPHSSPKASSRASPPPPQPLPAASPRSCSTRSEARSRATCSRRSRARLPRSLVTVDLGALRRNAARLVDVLDGAALWAVVKADGYGHGAVECGRAALEAGATALCAATVAEALELRSALPEPRIIVLGPAVGEAAAAREARLELTVPDGRLPEGVPVHLKIGRAHV